MSTCEATLLKETVNGKLSFFCSADPDLGS